MTKSEWKIDNGHMEFNAEGSASEDSTVHRRVRARGAEVRGFILANIERNPGNIAHLVAERFGISRQAANKHLKNLVAEGALLPEGKTRYRRYKVSVKPTHLVTRAIRC